MLLGGIFILKSKNLEKKLIILFLFIVLLCSVQASFACTGVYVGSDVSEDGTVIYARSNDYGDVFGNYVNVTPAVENESGRYMPVSLDGKTQTEIPATTYRYTSTPFMNSTTAYNGLQKDAAACTNEHGVVMSMSVTAFPNDAAIAADPHIDSGLTEFTASDLVICQSKTARDAVNLLCGIIDKYGSSETNIAFIADQSEAWLVEMYTGHQYAAVKLPTDKVSVFGNEFSLEYLSDFKDYIISKDLLSLPVEKGFAVYGRNNELNLLDTYSGNETITEYSHMRTWIGHQILSPSQFSDDYNHSARYPLCFTPDKKVSIYDVAQIMRNRFEGTKYSPDETGRIDMRVIGTDTALSVHILQIFKDLPAEMSAVTWISDGPAIYGVFVPLSNDCVNVSDVYGANQPADEKGVFDTENYPYYVFKELSTRCVGPDNYKVYGEPVKGFWKEAESNMFDGMSEVLKKAAEIEDKTEREEYITSYCNKMQTQAFEDAKQILRTVTWEQNKNSNTFKIKRNPETHQLTGEKVVYPQIKIGLNASSYIDVPEVSESENTTVYASDLVKVFRNETQFHATFTDSEGKYLAEGSEVTFNLNGVDYNRTVGENGSAKININLNPGNYIITSINHVTGENRTNNIRVISRIIENRNITKYYKNATQYTVKLIGDNGSPVGAGEIVTFNINGVLYNRTTNESAIAKLNINLEPGNYVITADYKGCKASNNITVISKISQNVDITKYYKNATQYTVKILGDDGSPVGAGEIVTFNINGVFYNRTTDESGIAKLNINLEPGNYIITADYKGCKASNNITVLPVLSGEDLTKKYGTADQFTATLFDGQGKALAGENVTFNINGVIYTRLTDSIGEAKLNINLMPGEYIITSSYNATSISNKITITS